jgi:putative membrane protein
MGGGVMARTASATGGKRVRSSDAGDASPGLAVRSADSWLRVIERGLFVGGLVLFGVLLYEVGPGAVVANIRVVGWGILPVVAQEALAYTCNTLGWWYAFPAPGPQVGFRRLMASRIAGDAVNYITPTATVGGEFVRVRMLRDRVAATPVVASVAIAKLSQTVAQMAFIVAGLVIVLRTTALPAPLRHGLFASLVVMAAVAVPLFIAQRRGLSAPLVRTLTALGFTRSARAVAVRLERLDEEIAAFHAAGTGHFLRSMACFFVGWSLGAVEVTLALFFLHIPLTLERVLVIEILSTTIDAILFFVPGKVGTQEGGKVLIFAMLGLDPAQGLSFALMRRIREMVWAGVGLLILSRDSVGR